MCVTRTVGEFCAGGVVGGDRRGRFEGGGSMSMSARSVLAFVHALSKATAAFFLQEEIFSMLRRHSRHI